MSKGYTVLSLDELGRYPQGDSLLMPLRHTLGLRPFGANAWTAEVGDHVVPRHSEDSGDEELYVVIRGRARFTVGESTVDGVPGTLVHVRAGTERQAIAEEEETVVLAVGGTPGKAFEPRGWDEIVIAFGKAEQGDVAGARDDVEALIGKHPNEWPGWYNLACFEARWGDRDTALSHLERAVKLDALAVEYARNDSDFNELHGDARWQAIVG